MNCQTLASLSLAGAVALFAGLTWWSTRTYAYLAGITLFIQASKDITGTSQGVDRPLAKRTMKALRKAFPAVYLEMRECLNQEIRREIEE
ncbi:MAG: hypothetical protein WB755_14540 [Terriglobales bacterium]